MSQNAKKLTSSTRDDGLEHPSETVLVTVTADSFPATRAHLFEEAIESVIGVKFDGMHEVGSAEGGKINLRAVGDFAGAHSLDLDDREEYAASHIAFEIWKLAAGYSRVEVEFRKALEVPLRFVMDETPYAQNHERLGLPAAPLV